MKLQNKKTGEIGYLQNDTIVKRIRVVNANNDTIGEYKSLAELNEEWEDYVEPKEYWFIDYDGGIIPFSRMKETATDRMMKQIGNYFDSREEAEKAVEKLKAWKRLKDKGFKAISSNICGDDFVANFKLNDHVDYSQSMDDFDCILGFGGGE